ncbi:Aste57867_21386 [Aphanomyces stellatus]|uniref:Aste57867_21386 protein n=1 Tax=Aphanomyces stellatus TaxID=120398 RepID=A0A485LHB6_9STRA|nr:hypothetical protein As57867_021317 [Aphanomyces stellatus]VFT98057.1 Aste57867_21386 [Aphanomyces stellatus]
MPQVPPASPSNDMRSVDEGSEHYDRENHSFKENHRDLPPRGQGGQPADDSHGGYRGRCLYKTGKCENERAMKTNGQAHNLCDMHRLRQNQNQRKLDGKNRNNRTSYSPYSRDSNASAAVDSQYSEPPKQMSPRVVVKPEPVAIASSANISPRSNEEYVSPSAASLPQPHMLPPRSYFQPHAPSAPASPPHYPPPFIPAMASASSFPNPPTSHLRQPPSFHPHHGHLPPPPTTKSENMDEITVPTPSYLKGEAREAFRSRVLQKLVNIISEEVMTTTQQHQVPPSAPYGAPYSTSYEYAPPQYAYESPPSSHAHQHHHHHHHPPPPSHYRPPHSYHMDYDRQDSYHRPAAPFQPSESSAPPMRASSSMPLPKLQSLAGGLPSLLHHAKENESSQE